MTLKLGPKKRKAKIIHRYPNGNDPKKREMFGDDKQCSKCKLIKDIRYFHWKSDHYKGRHRYRIQAECGECREKQRHAKYNANPEIFLLRAYQMIKQKSARRIRRRKPVTITFEDFMKAWAAQKKKHGLICPISDQQMTHIQGLGNLETNISIDRIDSSKDYIKGNIQFICRRVNTMKHNESLESLIFWSRAIAEHYV
tara:strand:- start:56 stop:649 length:594 start_codon:yes stop_codon:yes gene_type:complete